MPRKAVPVKANAQKMSKAERSRREAEEKKLMAGNIEDYEPIALSPKGEEIFREIIAAIPSETLCMTDGYTVEIVADAVDQMRECRALIQSDGVLTEYTNKFGATNVDQNKAVLVYQKYSDIFKKHVSELGLTPAARSKIASLATENAEKRPSFYDLMKEDG